MLAFFSASDVWCLLPLLGGGGGCRNLEKTGVLDFFAGHVSFNLERAGVRLLPEADDADADAAEGEEVLRLPAEPRRDADGDPWLLLLLVLSRFPRIGEAETAFDADEPETEDEDEVVVDFFFAAVGLLSNETSS